MRLLEKTTFVIVTFWLDVMFGARRPGHSCVRVRVYRKRAFWQEPVMVCFDGPVIYNYLNWSYLAFAYLGTAGGFTWKECRTGIIIECTCRGYGSSLFCFWHIRITDQLRRLEVFKLVKNVNAPLRSFLFFGFLIIGIADSHSALCVLQSSAFVISVIYIREGTDRVCDWKETRSIW